ncbi:hypothetical protein GB937_003243 [Aspergillus fischeri]|nr:hypothetical protein GB937_003243 [Aspergillus fischeri]
MSTTAGVGPVDQAAHSSTDLDQHTNSAARLDVAAFDLIIVGGDTSGLVVANRLAEDPNTRVLVLEAGTNRLTDPRILVPGLAPTAYGDPDLDSAFRSIPQVHASSPADTPTGYMLSRQGQLNGLQLLASKGRTLGGSSAINLGLVIYPSRHAGSAYFGADVQHRPNLRVVTGALVVRIVLEVREASVIANGVQFRKGKRTYTVPATNEVILAAGATQTPQILELSGIERHQLLATIDFVSIAPGNLAGAQQKQYPILRKLLEDLDEPAAQYILAPFQLLPREGNGPKGPLLNEPSRMLPHHCLRTELPIVSRFCTSPVRKHQSSAGHRPWHSASPRRPRAPCTSQYLDRDIDRNRANGVAT